MWFFCYSWHWKEEEVEKKQLRNKLNNFSSSLSSSPKARDKSTTAEEDNEVHQQKEEEETEQTQGVIVDVFGHKFEPICTYYRCHHKLSLHGISSSHGCRCKHPMNKALGVFLRYS
jgi:hypothetical protein